MHRFLSLFFQLGQIPDIRPTRCPALATRRVVDAEGLFFLAIGTELVKTEGAHLLPRPLPIFQIRRVIP